MISAFLVSMVLLLHLWKGIPIGQLTRDPTAIVGVPFYIGFLSQIGIFFWSASAAVCMFSAMVISKRPDSLKIKGFFFASGLLTLVLVLDDAFLLHESVFPYHLGIAEKAVFVTYAGFVLLYLLRFYSVILNTEYILLVAALIFFGVSIALDIFNPPGLNPYLFEDAAKIAGIVSWLVYFFRVGIVAISCHDTQQKAAPD